MRYFLFYSSTEKAGEDQTKLFDRIDASKLQGALSNASMMGRLEVRTKYITCVGRGMFMYRG